MPHARTHTRISRKKLKERCYLPDELIDLQQHPLDQESRRHFYEPAVQLLKIMYEQI